MELWCESSYHPIGLLNFMINKNFLLIFGLALGASGVCMVPAQAQPDANNAPKADNPPNWNQGGGRRGGGGMRQQMTADQLRQIRAQQTEMRALNIRQQLTFAGYTDDAVQTAVVNYYKAQSEAQTPLLEQWQKIAQAVQVKTTPDTQMATMLNDFRAAVDKEKERRDTAYKALSAEIDLPKKPMLDAMLMTSGLAGDESSLVGQGNNGGLGGIVTMLGNMGFGGMMGGFAGGMGGPGGGGGFAGGMGGPGGGGGFAGGMGGGPGGGGRGGQGGPGGGGDPFGF